MLELIFQGFMEWAYGLALECWEYFSSSLLDIMSMDYAYMKSHVPVMVSIAQVLLAVGWALLIKAFCQTIYRTSELTGDAIVHEIVDVRGNFNTQLPIDSCVQ